MKASTHKEEGEYELFQKEMSLVVGVTKCDTHLCIPFYLKTNS